LTRLLVFLLIPKKKLFRVLLLFTLKVNTGKYVSPKKVFIIIGSSISLKNSLFINSSFELLLLFLEDSSMKQSYDKISGIGIKAPFLSFCIG